MKREETIKLIKSNKLIAIIRGLSREAAVETAEVLYHSGFRLMEVTFQAEPESWETTLTSIADIRSRLGDSVGVGAGTVVSTEQVALAKDAGAEYIISPNMVPEVIARTRTEDLVSMPGALTPTEITTAYNCGADLIKIFPVNTLGPSYIKAILSPLPQIPLVAVGGVNLDNLSDFFKAGITGAGIGGNLVNKKIVENREFENLARQAEQYVKIACQND